MVPVGIPMHDPAGINQSWPVSSSQAASLCRRTVSSDCGRGISPDARWSPQTPGLAGGEGCFTLLGDQLPGCGVRLELFGHATRV